MNPRPRFLVVLVAMTAVFAVAATVLLLWAPGSLAAGETAKGAAIDPQTAAWGLMAAALAASMSALGAGFAVAKVGAAAIGALAERPELFGRLLVFVGLAEGIAIYGLIVSILILDRLT